MIFYEMDPDAETRTFLVAKQDRMVEKGLA